MKDIEPAFKNFPKGNQWSLDGFDIDFYQILIEDISPFI